MQLNLPIFDQLQDSQNILIAGAGGGFDVFCGLPIYFTLREMGKSIHLANFSFTDFPIAKYLSDPIEEIDGLLLRTYGNVKRSYSYYPEGYLTQWFKQTQHEDVTIWMFARSGIPRLKLAYQYLVDKLKIDALILIDGGVDSIMCGDESAPGTLVEDSISLGAIQPLDIPTKLLVCLGFGTEVEEGVCHHHALENIAALAKENAFYGSCALTAQMPAFQKFDEACRYVWEQPEHHKSHISTRIIPAVHGEFGNYHLYDDDLKTRLFISPLMSLYWFFDATTVIQHNQIIPLIQTDETVTNAIQTVMRYSLQKRQAKQIRPKKPIPY